MSSINNDKTQKQTSNPKKEVAGAKSGGGKTKDKVYFVKNVPTTQVFDGWTRISARGEGGGPGLYAITNGNSAMIMDELGNYRLVTGKPGDSGCGGKMVQVAHDFIVKGHSYAGQFTGSSSERQKDGKSEEIPAYSIHATGEVAIEAMGGDAGIMGDNVVIHARKNLILKSGNNIQIEAGNGNGQVNLAAAKFVVDSAFIHQNAKGVHTDGTAEMTVNQDMPGARTTVNTRGSITYTVDGSYRFAVGGKFELDGGANMLLKSGRGGISIKAKGPSYEDIGGIKETKVKAVPVPPMAPATDAWKIELGAAKTSGIKIDSQLGITAKFNGGINMLKFMGKTTTISSPTTKFTGGMIYLN